MHFLPPSVFKFGLILIFALYRMYGAHRKGYVVTNTFQGIHSLFNKISYGATTYTIQTRWGAEAITTCITAVVLVFTGRAVGRGEMTVGAFVVFMSTVNSFAPTLGSVIREIFNIGTGYANILRVANLLNADTRRKQLLRGQIRRQKLMATYKRRLPPDSPFDEDAFFMHDVTYRFSKSEHSLLPPLNCNIEGGQMVALQGQGSVGKKTVLRLMARHFIPTTGFIYYPSRWRCVRFPEILFLACEPWFSDNFLCRTCIPI
jgi:ABC-type bacteriocin/lantibiotic exporter with double-glycine peptidase domain